MPVRRTERQSERPSPYDLKRPAMAAAVLSPSMSGWQPMSIHTPVTNWQPQQVQQYQSSQPRMSDYSQSMMNNGLNLQPQPQRPQSQSHQHQHQQPQHTLTAPPNQQGHERRPSTSHAQSQADGPWTVEMDTILMDAQARGLRWEQISQQFFPAKSANACRKRYGRAKEERRATDWDEHRVHRVMAAYNKESVREQMWSIVARSTGERWQDIERLCYSQGLVKMTRGRANHSRSRSRVGGSQTAEESRYPSPSDDYDSRDDSGIGLGLMGGHDSHVAAVSGPPVVTSMAMDNVLRPLHHQYTYRQ